MKALAALILIVGTQHQSTHDVLMAPARNFVAAFNAHRTELPADTFTEDCAVIDEFPPFVWTSARSWYATLIGRADASQRFSIGEPQFLQLRSNAAYFVLPSTIDYTANGKPRRQKGNWVISEKRVNDRWLISGHAFAVTSDGAKNE